MLGNIFSTLAAKVLGGVAVVLLIVAGVQTLRASHYQSKAENCEIGRANDRKAYELAAQQSEAKAVAAKLAEETRSRQNAERNNDELESLRGRLADANARYIAANSVRRKAAPGAASGATSPADDHGPQEPVGAGEVAILVGRPDFDILIENTLRLKAAHDWAETLNQPIPDPQFGSDGIAR